MVPDADDVSALDDDELVEVTDPDAHPPVRPAGPIRRKTFGGAMLAAAMVGLQEVLEGPKEQPVVLEIGSGTDGPDDDPVAVDLDPFDPAGSIAVVRPWLY